MDRRVFLKKSFGCCSLALASGFLAKRLAAADFFWPDVYRAERLNGKAEIAFLEGKVLEGGQRIVSKSLEGNLELSLGFTGRLVLILEDRSVLFLRGKGEFELNLGRTSGAVLVIKQGAAQVITNKNAPLFYPLIVQTNLNNYGVSDGLVYFEVPLGEPWDQEVALAELRDFPLADDNFPLKKMDKKLIEATAARNPLEDFFSAETTAVAEDATVLGVQEVWANDHRDFSLFPQYNPIEREYVCLCAGTLNLLDARLTRNLEMFQNNYHRPFYFFGANDFRTAGLYDHNDALLKKLLGYSDTGAHQILFPPSPETMSKVNIWLGYNL